MRRHYELVNRAAASAELGMMDKASIAVGKPTKRAQEALDDAEATLALAFEFQARQKAVKQRERDLHNQSTEAFNRQQRADRQAAEGELAKRQVADLQRELAAAKKREQAADERAELYRQGRDQAIDELRTLRPQRGPGLSR